MWFELFRLLRRLLFVGLSITGWIGDNSRREVVGKISDWTPFVDWTWVWFIWARLLVNMPLVLAMLLQDEDLEISLLTRLRLIIILIYSKTNFKNSKIFHVKFNSICFTEFKKFGLQFFFKKIWNQLYFNFIKIRFTIN